MTNYLREYFQCPEEYLGAISSGSAVGEDGYFRFGDKVVCYGKCRGKSPAKSPAGELPDLYPHVSVAKRELCLPFDLQQVVDNLRLERYARTDAEGGSYLDSAINSAYYLIRPLLPVAVRKHLQRARLNGWRDIRFPHWPVDCTVDNLFTELLNLSLRGQQWKEIPFIWYWPDGAPSCAIMTHDVETTTGRDFCGTLMDLDDRYGIKAAFQVVPEQRYEVTSQYLESITARGFEFGVQDLNHDGRLYKDHGQFMSRVKKINEYGRKWGTRGFRAGVLYRREEWFDALDFSFEMSVPNVAHLDPQHGGCCTVMPYFIGNLLEVPVTTTQDYSLFFILKQHSIDLWRRQIQMIMEKYGLISFIIHPDYIIGERERETYETLLKYLSQLRDEKGIWTTVPSELDRWWRQRAKMRLVRNGSGWKIEGEGKERARIAYASEELGQIKFSFESEETRVNVSQAGQTSPGRQ
jgi:hypothetical protein